MHCFIDIPFGLYIREGTQVGDIITNIARAQY